MRGYLQRLALGVMRPVGTIHPMVGSVFSAQHQAGTSEAPLREASVLISSQAKSDAKGSQEDAKARSVSSEEKSSGTLEPNRLRAPDPVYTPLISKVDAIQSKNKQSEDFSRPAEEASSSHFAERSTAEALPEANVQPEGRTEELVLTHVYTPKMSESTVRSSSLKIPAQKMDPFAAAPRSTPRENSSRRSATPSRQPDEIQIHIGRIEVTAVQQAPVPPAVKPTRKGLSLDEYLQRANRRVR